MLIFFLLSHCKFLYNFPIYPTFPFPNVPLKELDSDLLLSKVGLFFLIMIYETAFRIAISFKFRVLQQYSFISYLYSEKPFVCIINRRYMLSHGKCAAVLATLHYKTHYYMSQSLIYYTKIQNYTSFQS